MWDEALFVSESGKVLYMSKERVNFDAFVIVFRAEIPCPYYCPSVFCLFRVFKIL